MCAAIIDTQDLEKVREELRPLRLPGQVKLHWTDERNSRRRKIVDTLSGIDSMQAIITHQSEVSKKTERHRRKCLEQMYFELSEMHVHNVTLESRQEAQNKRDIAHIVALQGQGQSAGIRLRHVRGGDDPLLWIPDAVLGALNSVHLGKSSTGRSCTRKWSSTVPPRIPSREAKTLGPVVRLGPRVFFRSCRNRWQ